MTSHARCSCGAEIVWALLPTGKRIPLNPAAAEPDARVVAFNPDTGGGYVLKRIDVEEGRPRRWALSGATFHTAHFDECPNAGQHRRGDAQGTLEEGVA